MLLSENWSRPQDERKIPTRTATKSTTKRATSHISLTTVSIPTARNCPLAQLLSTGDTQAAHHCRTVVLLWPAVLMTVHASSHHTVPPPPSPASPPGQWSPLAGGPPPHEPPPSGCPQDRWPRHPASGLSMRTGENQQNWGSQLRHHGLYDGPHCMTPPRGPPPFRWHHSGGPPMPPFPYPFPWHFNPYNPWPPHHSYVQQPRSQSQ